MRNSPTIAGFLQCNGETFKEACVHFIKCRDIGVMLLLVYLLCSGVVTKLQQNLGCMFRAGKIHLNHRWLRLLVILLLLIQCLMFPHCLSEGSVFGPCFVMHYLVSFTYTVVPTKSDGDVMF